MNETVVVQSILKLMKISQTITPLKNDQDKLIQSLNKLPKVDLEHVMTYYEGRGKISKIRYEIARLLYDGIDINIQVIEKTLKDVSSNYNNNILKNWNDYFSIFYVFFTIPKKNEIDQSIYTIKEFFNKNLSNKELIDIKFQNFNGNRNFGEIGCWMAIYNNCHNSQQEAIQLFVNFFVDNFNYGILDYSNDKYLETPISLNFNTFNEKSLTDLIGYFNSKESYIKEDSCIEVEVESELLSSENFNLEPLNQILYGPPGTGKTYKTINKALEVILKLSEEYNKKSKKDKEIELLKKAIEVLGDKVKDLDNPREILKDCFDKYNNDGQIEFITFHQSYGYEEFVEGIKAETNNKMIEYDVQPGVFQTVAKIAEENFKQSISNNNVVNFEKLINDFGNYADEQISLGKPLDIDHSSYQLVKVRKDIIDNTQSFIVGKDDNSQSLTRKILLRDIDAFFKNKIKDFKDIKPTYESQSSYHGNAVYYFELLKHIRLFYNKHKKAKCLVY